MAWYDSGKKVVCIKRGAWNKINPRETDPVYGDVLTIRTSQMSESKGKRYLRFFEIRNPLCRVDSHGASVEAAYAVDQFCPVQPTKRSTETGMQTLKAIAAGEPVREDA